MINFIICTHKRHDLAIGAINSLFKNCLDPFRVTVLDSSGTFECYIKNIATIYISCPRYHHAHFARNISKNNELTICIDDDVRLVLPIKLSTRYINGWYKHLNGHMVQAWTDPKVSFPYTRLTQWRTSVLCKDLPPDTCKYASATDAEQIDTIWLHIDKGSTDPTSARDALIRHLDK